MLFIFTYGNYKCQNLHFKKVTSSPLPDFLAIAQPKMRILLWNLVCVLFAWSFTTCIPVSWITPKFWILLGFIFEKSKFWVLGVQIEKYQNSDIAILKNAQFNAKNNHIADASIVLNAKLAAAPFLSLNWLVGKRGSASYPGILHVFGLHFTSNLYILESFIHLSLFQPKCREHDVTKTRFSQKFLDGFFWNFGRRRQIDDG